MKKRKLTKKERELQQQAALCSKSVDFWYSEIVTLFDQIDELERNECPDSTKMDELLKKLESLIKKGDQESEIIERLEGDVADLLNKKADKKKAQPKSVRKRPGLCPKHPEYQALRKPTANCFTCIAIWGSNGANQAG